MRGRYPQGLAMLTVLLATLATSALAQGTASVSATNRACCESCRYHGSLVIVLSTVFLQVD